MTTKFNMVKDISGFNGFGLPFADNKYSTTLAAGVEQTLTVPNSPFADCPNFIAIFSFAPGSSVWVSLNATAVTAGGAFAAVSSEMNPAARYVTGGDVLHFKTVDASDEIGVIFYATL